ATTSFSLVDTGFLNDAGNHTVRARGIWLQPMKDRTMQPQQLTKHHNPAPADTHPKHQPQPRDRNRRMVRSRPAAPASQEPRASQQSSSHQPRAEDHARTKPVDRLQRQSTQTAPTPPPTPPSGRAEAQASSPTSSPRGRPSSPVPSAPTPSPRLPVAPSRRS